MDGGYLLTQVIRPTCAWLASNWNIPQNERADQQLLTTAYQESGLTERIQRVNGGGFGPARGWWQFERIGVQDVVQRREAVLRGVCEVLDFEFNTSNIYTMVAFNDTLACAVARLTLHLDKHPLPQVHDGDGGFDYYARNWRPGAFTRGSEAQQAALRAKWRGYWTRAQQERAAAV